VTLIRWLKRQAPPKRIDKATDAAVGSGRVVASFRTGSVVLAGPNSDVTLVWREGGTRALSAGTYRVRTTRIERRKKGVHWFLSSTSPPRERITVKVDHTARIEVGATVHFKCRVRRQGDRMQLGFAITGADGRGLSIYKNDRRVPVAYQVLGKDGRVLASGTMNYG
jgi:hypothetical protein